MEMPGMSIFQGNDSIKLDTSANRLEEEEALEDQRRRNEELGNELQDAFDDLIDDDDITVDHSGNFQSHFEGGEPQNGPLHNRIENGIEKPAFLYGSLLEKRAKEQGQGDHRDCKVGMEKLKKTIESKSSEIEIITKQLTDERKHNDDLKKRLALSEAEKARAQMTREQTHELLVESKMKISDLEETVTKLQGKMKNLESENTNLVADLERTRLQLSDAQNKYLSVERNAGYSADRHADNLVKQANERFAAKVELLQGQIDCLTNKLEAKEREYNALDARYKELQRNREALLVDKSETINHLARSLEESQRHCQELMSKPDHSHENFRLQRLVKQYEQQTEDMQRTINDLTSRLDATAAELNTMEGIVLGETADVSGSIRLTKSNVIGSTPVNDRLAQLKDELCRSISGQKQKREEIRKLQDQITKLNEEIEKLRSNENNSLIEITTLREEIVRLNSRIRLVEIERDSLRNDSEREKNLNQELDELMNEKQILSRELQTTKLDYEMSQRRNASLQAEIDELLAKLQTKEQNDKLVAELKIKAEQFEEYIRNQKHNSRDSSTAMSPRKFHDRAIETSPESNSRNSSIDSDTQQKIESRIRNEMAKAFAVKMKSIESVFQEQLNALNDEADRLKTDLTAAYKDLQIREQEVDILKHAILREREKAGELLNEQSKGLDKYRRGLEEQFKTALSSKDIQIKNLRAERAVERDSIKEERITMKSLVKQWEEDRKSIERREMDLQRRIRELEDELDDKVKQYKNKAETASTACTYYKQYAKSVERHMRSEYDRLKIDYERAVTRAKEEMKAAHHAALRKLKERQSNQEDSTRLQIEKEVDALSAERTNRESSTPLHMERIKAPFSTVMGTDKESTRLLAETNRVDTFSTVRRTDQESTCLFVERSNIEAFRTNNNNRSDSTFPTTILQ